MLKKILAVAALSAVTALAVASEGDARGAAKQVIELQDGSLLYVFTNGRMAEENRLGRAISVKQGTVLTARDGSRITMIGNDVARLDDLLKQDQRGD